MTIYFSAPKKLRAEDGRVIIGFDKLSTAEQQAYGYNPVPVPDPVAPDPQTPERIQAETKQAVKDMLDNKAREYGFDTIHTAGTWRDGLQPHADDLIVWGAACLNKAAEIFSDFGAGKRPMPTTKDVLIEMPKFGAVAK